MTPCIVKPQTIVMKTVKCPNWVSLELFFTNVTGMFAVYITHSDYASDQKSCHLQNRNKSEDHLVWDRPDEICDCSYLKHVDTMMSSPERLWLADVTRGSLGRDTHREKSFNSTISSVSVLLLPQTRSITRSHQDSKKKPVFCVDNQSNITTYLN